MNLKSAKINKIGKSNKKSEVEWNKIIVNEAFPMKINKPMKITKIFQFPFFYSTYFKALMCVIKSILLLLIILDKIL